MKAERRASELDAEASRLLVAAEALRMDAAASPDLVLQSAAEDAHAESVTAFRTYVNARMACRDLADRIAELDPATSTTELEPDIWRSSSERTDG